MSKLLTLKEFREATKALPDDSTIVVNWQLLENIDIHSIDTDPDNKEIILFSWGDE